MFRGSHRYGLYANTGSTDKCEDFNMLEVKVPTPTHQFSQHGEFLAVGDGCYARRPHEK